jgi:hypothetical protein
MEDSSVKIQGLTYEHVKTSHDYSGAKVYHLRQVDGVGVGTVIEVRQWAKRPDLWLAETLNGCMLRCTLQLDPATGRFVDITERVNMGEMRSAPDPRYPGGVRHWYTKPTLDGVPVV